MEDNKSRKNTQSQPIQKIGELNDSEYRIERPYEPELFELERELNNVYYIMCRQLKRYHMLSSFGLTPTGDHVYEILIRAFEDENGKLPSDKRMKQDLELIGGMIVRRAIHMENTGRLPYNFIVKKEETPYLCQKSGTRHKQISVRLII